MSDNLDEYYSSAARSFDSNRLDTVDEVQQHSAWFATDSENKSVVDVGCGTGRYTLAFRKLGLLAIGVDHSVDQIEQAIKKVPAMISSAFALPFAESSFDRLSYMMMLHQIEKNLVESAFKEAQRVLKKESAIWIKTCSYDDLERRPLNDLFPSSLKINQHRYLDIPELDKKLMNCGFVQSRSINIANSVDLRGDELIGRISARHNSTLYLLPETEFNNGMRRILEEFPTHLTHHFTHYHTLLEYRKI